jgi:hypothetical protein
MPFTLPLPAEWSDQEWKVKIFGDERNEEPHATVIRKVRTGEFLDRTPPPRDVPSSLMEWIWKRRRTLRSRWNEMYPENPVFSQEDPS